MMVLGAIQVGSLLLALLAKHASGDQDTPRVRRREQVIMPTLFTGDDNQFRIVGGSNAQSGKYPYMVKASGCGASLIAPDMLLTAAHCLNAFGGTLRIGSVNANSGGETARAVLRIQHPNYQGNNNDFMVVKLNKQVKATPVKLNGNKNSPSTNEALTVIGFGRLEEGGKSTTRLQQVTVPYVAHSQCRRVYGGIVEASMLCAGTAAGGKDSCQGDSGGPIMNSKGEQVGVVSFGSGCARPGIPGVYARTSGAIDWIEKMICDHSSSNQCSGVDIATIEDSEDGNDVQGQLGQIRVKIVHDKYPKEVSWRVVNPAGKVVLSQNENDVQLTGMEVNKAVNAVPGNYGFVIDDGWGDGICCSQGEGSVEIYANGKRVASHKGDYKRTQTLNFSVSESPTDTILGQIDVQYDVFPREFSWRILNSKNQEVAGRAINTVDRQKYFLRSTVSLVPGETYRVELRDGYGDGIDYQVDGKVDVYAMVNGNRQNLYFNNGRFGASANGSFKVPSNIASKSGDDVGTDMFANGIKANNVVGGAG